MTLSLEPGNGSVAGTALQGAVVHDLADLVASGQRFPTRRRDQGRVWD